MKVYQLVIASAAVAWPSLVTAQDASGTGGGLLGATVDKGTVSAPEKAPVELAGPKTAGTDPKTGEPGDIALPEPEVAEVPAASGSTQVADEGPAVAEAAGAAQGPVEAPAASGLADMMLDTSEVVPEPAAEAPEPRPEVEIGADPVQAPVDVVPDADVEVAAAELGDGSASDEDAPGEEFVRLTREDTIALPRPTRPELLEALAAAVLTPPSATEFVGGDIGPDVLVTVALPGEAEEPREADLAAFMRSSGAANAVLEAAAAGEFIPPDLEFADVTEEVVTGAEAAVLAALADDPQADFEIKTMTDPNQIVCLEALGEPFAGVPANDAGAWIVVIAVLMMHTSAMTTAITRRAVATEREAAQEHEHGEPSHAETGVGT